MEDHPDLDVVRDRQIRRWPCRRIGMPSAFLVIGAILLAFRFVCCGFGPFGLWFLLIGPLLLFLFSGVGKALGVLLSRMRLRRSVRRLLDVCASRHGVGSRLATGELPTKAVHND